MSVDPKQVIGLILIAVSVLTLLVGAGVKGWPSVRQKLSGLRKSTERRELLGGADVVKLLADVQAAYELLLEENAALKKDLERIDSVLKGVTSGGEA